MGKVDISNIISIKIRYFSSKFTVQNSNGGAPNKHFPRLLCTYIPCIYLCTFVNTVCYGLRLRGVIKYNYM